jgi:hypothetical protein
MCHQAFAEQALWSAETFGNADWLTKKLQPIMTLPNSVLHVSRQPFRVNK